MSEGRRRRGIGQVVGGHVNRLHRRDRALLGRSDALLQLAHFGGQVGLVSHGGGHAAQQRRDFRTRLREAENVVDEQQRVRAFFVAEVLGDGQRGQRHAQTRSRRLGHLAVDQGRLRLRRLLDVDHAGFLHFQPQVVALAGALAHAGEHGEAAVLQRDVVDELHDDDRLAHAGAAEQADLAALQEGLDQVDDLHAGLEHLHLRGLLVEGGRRAVNGHCLSASPGPACPPGLPMTFSTRPSVPRPTGTVIGPPRSMAFMPRTMPSVGSMATQRTRPSPNCCSTSRMTSMGAGTLKPSLVTRSAE